MHKRVQHHITIQERIEESIRKVYCTADGPIGLHTPIPVSSGTAALQLSLIVVGVEANDMVITPSFSYVATSNAITYCGAQPLFLDIEKDTLGLSPTALKHFLEHECIVEHGVCLHVKSGKRIKACIPVHVFGHACQIDQIVSICQKYCIAVVEDSAEAIGSLFHSKHVGRFGDVGILSFNGNKTVTGGGGGAIITDSEILAQKARHLATQARVIDQYQSVHDEIGFNFQLPNLNAALICAQLERLESFVISSRKTKMRIDL